MSLSPMYLTIPMVVTVIGALVYGISNNPKGCEMGRIAYAFGLLTTLLALAHR